MIELAVGLLCGFNLTALVFIFWRMNRHHVWLTNDFERLRRQFQLIISEHSKGWKAQNAGVKKSLDSMQNRISDIQTNLKRVERDKGANFHNDLDGWINTHEQQFHAGQVPTRLEQ